MSKHINIGGLELVVSARGVHEGRQGSKWDDLRHHLMTDGKPDKTLKIEGFEKGPDASNAAKRLRDVWDLNVKSYQNIKTSKYGICFKDDDEKETPEKTEPTKNDLGQAELSLDQENTDHK